MLYSLLKPSRFAVEWAQDESLRPDGYFANWGGIGISRYLVIRDTENTIIELRPAAAWNVARVAPTWRSPELVKTRICHFGALTLNCWRSCYNITNIFGLLFYFLSGFQIIKKSVFQWVILLLPSIPSACLRVFVRYHLWNLWVIRPTLLLKLFRCNFEISFATSRHNGKSLRLPD